MGTGAFSKKIGDGGAAADAHLFFFGAGGKTGRAALDDEAGKFLAVDFREDDVDVGESAVGDPHFLAVENPVLAVGREHGAGARGERIGSGLRLGEAVAGEQFAGGDFRQIFLLLLFGAEIDDGHGADAGVAAVRDGERGVAGEFFGEDRGGNFVEPRAAVRFGNAGAEQADFAGLLEHLGHQMLVFVRFQLGDRGHDFFLHEFFGGLADQALVVGEVRGSEDVFGAAGSDAGMRRRD